MTDEREQVDYSPSSRTALCLLDKAHQEIERLTEDLKMEEDCYDILANDFNRVEGENRKLRYVMETAETMRDDYESYGFSDAYDAYVTEVHDPDILEDFDKAVKAVNCE